MREGDEDDEVRTPRASGIPGNSKGQVGKEIKRRGQSCAIFTHCAC